MLREMRHKEFMQFLDEFHVIRSDVVLRYGVCGQVEQFRSSVFTDRCVSPAFGDEERRCCSTWYTPVRCADMATCYGVFPVSCITVKESL